MAKSVLSLSVAAVVACFLTTACSGHRPGVLIEDAAYGRPGGNFLKYAPSLIEGEMVSRAKEKLTRACLQRFGFKVGSGGPVILIDTGEANVLLRSQEEVAFRSLSDTEKLGFHPRNAVIEGSRNFDDIADIEALDVVLNGTRDGRAFSYKGNWVTRFGCVGEADDSLSRGVKFNFTPSWPGGEMDAINMLLEIRLEAERGYDADVRGNEIDNKWAKCLESKSRLSYGSPKELARDPKWLETGSPTSREREVAFMSRECQMEVNYLRESSKVREDIESKLTAKYRQRLNAIWMIFEARIKNAECVLSEKDVRAC